MKFVRIEVPHTNLVSSRRSSAPHTNLLAFLLIAFLLAISIPGKSQEQGKSFRKEAPAFIGITAGISPASFRDFATSPLVYEGMSAYAGLTRLKVNVNREYESGIAASAGWFNSDFNDHSAAARAFTLSAFYSRLYNLKFLSAGKWDVKAGGMFNTTGNIRLNEAFGNNGLGFELFPTLFGSVKFTRDISRTTGREKDFLFFNYRSKPRTRNISFRFNPGLVNSALRNKYAYLLHSAAIDDGILKDYKYTLFSGLRFSSALDYTVLLGNKNSYQVSYLWDAYRSGGKLDKYEMARNTLKFTVYFNTNNK